ncbi:MAG: VTT domain-containing protein, partial [Acidobacteriota bacterium]
VGSANLSNRSMGFDTECDLAVDSGGNARTEEAIESFRGRLLGEHLRVDAQRVVDAIRKEESLIKAVDKLRGDDSTLEALNGKDRDVAQTWLCDAPFVDPERVTAPSELIDQFVPEEVKTNGHGNIVRSAAILLVLLGFAAAWQWTSLREWMSLDAVTYWASYIGDRPSAPLIVMAAYSIGGLVVFPVTLLVVATAVAFSTFTAFWYSLMGCLSSAITLFMVGHFMGRETVRRFAGSRLNRLSRTLAQQGLLTVITLRLFPVAPYTVINFVAGASHIRFRDYILGTILGLLPGILAITILGDRLGNAIRHPRLENFMALAVLVALFIAANILVRKRLERRGKPEAALAGGQEIE